MPPNLEALPKGYEFPPTPLDLSSEWVQGYVLAVEDEAIGGLSEGLVPAMAVAALALRAILDSAKLPPGAIHLGQELAFLRPVHVGERLWARALVASRGERQGWILMGIDLNVGDESARPAMTGRAMVTMPCPEPQPETWKR